MSKVCVKGLCGLGGGTDQLSVDQRMFFSLDLLEEELRKETN